MGCNPTSQLGYPRARCRRLSRFRWRFCLFCAWSFVFVVFATRRRVVVPRRHADSGASFWPESSHTRGNVGACKVFKYDDALYLPSPPPCVMSVTAISEEYPTPAEAAVVRAAEQFMEETMSNFSDPSHDPHHVRRVRRTALRLARSLTCPSRDADGDLPTPAPDLLTVELAALLHDVLDKKYVPPASYGHDARAFFEPFFQRAQAAAPVGALDLRADGRADAIVRIVENVSWSNEQRLRASGGWGHWHETCVELHCVQDADRLDAIGAFGVMRCAAYSAVTKRPLYVPNGDADQPESAIQHFHDKLLHIQEQMKTAPGKQMAEKRHKLLVDFLAAIEDEYGRDA